MKAMPILPHTNAHLPWTQHPATLSPKRKRGEPKYRKKNTEERREGSLGKPSTLSEHSNQQPTLGLCKSTTQPSLLSGRSPKATQTASVQLTAYTARRSEVESLQLLTPKRCLTEALCLARNAHFREACKTTLQGTH